GPVGAPERAAGAPANRRARVFAVGRSRVGGWGPRGGERTDFVVAERARGPAGAAIPAVVAPPRQRLTGRARATRRNGAQLLRHARFRRLDSACEGAFFVVDDSGPLVAQAPPELDQLVGP